MKPFRMPFDSNPIESYHPSFLDGTGLTLIHKASLLLFYYVTIHRCVLITDILSGKETFWVQEDRLAREQNFREAYHST